MFGEVIALDFDLACTTRLLYYDLDKEKRMAETMAMGQVSKSLGVPSGLVDRSKAQRW